MGKNKAKKEEKKQKVKTSSSIRPFKEVLLDIVRKKKDKEDPEKIAEMRERLKALRPRKEKKGGNSKDCEDSGQD